MPRTLFIAARILWLMLRKRVEYFFRVNVGGQRPGNFMTAWVRFFTDFIMEKTGTDLHVSGLHHLGRLPADRPIVAVSNHESYLDIPSIMAALGRPVGFIAKELTRIPLLGFWIRVLGGYLIDRTDLRASLETLTRGVQAEPGKVLLIFPEGTRNRASTVAPFKPGSLRLAFENSAIIVPLCVCGGRRKFEGNGYRIRRGGIHVEILPPVDTRGVPVQEKRRLTAELHAGILRVYERIAPLSA